MGLDTMKKWTAVVLTCSKKSTALAYHKELELKQRKGDIAKDVILLCVEDPKSHVGSGGATLNALLSVTEHISERHGSTVVNPDLLYVSHILILHVGRSYPFDPCGRPFVTLPFERSDVAKSSSESLVCHIDLLIHQVTSYLAVNSPAGVWVCSTDMLLDIPHTVEPFDFTDVDACAVSVPGSLDYATKHGVYKLSSKGYVDDIVYQGSSDSLQGCVLESGMEEDAQVPLVSGIVFFGAPVAERLLALHVIPPTDSCTYMGLDSGSQPLQLSLFFDLMLAMCGDIDEDSFVSGSRGTTYGRSAAAGDSQALTTMKQARQVIWKELNSKKLKVYFIPEGKHNYMSNFGTRLLSHITEFPSVSSYVDNPSWRRTQRCHSFIHRNADVHESVTLINSLIGEGIQIGEKSVISHSYLHRQLKVGKGCIISGIVPQDIPAQGPRIKINDDLIVLSVPIQLPHVNDSSSRRALIVLGMQDRLSDPVGGENITFCNIPWSKFLEETQIKPDDLWDPSTADERRNLLTARLFPLLHVMDTVGLSKALWLQGGVQIQHQALKQKMHTWKSSWRLSLEEIFFLVNLDEEFTRRRDLFYAIGEQIVRDTLLSHKGIGLNRLYRSAAVEGYSLQLLNILDKTACECKSPGIAARCLANIADVLGAMAQSKGGLRSGPAANHQWSIAFQLMEKGDIIAGVKALAEERSRWYERPDLLIRAARHYEGAAQILIRHAVMTARKFFVTSECSPPGKDKWVTVECPARIDIAGGWSDTPPITYEHGGAVINAAITLDGQKPIGAKAKRIDKSVLELNLIGEGVQGTKIVVSELSQMSDYNQPHAPGALLKAAFICADVIQYPSPHSLSDQLMRKYQGGFELHTWSNLPHGSGLGTSSILAGAVMAAVLRASGKQFDIDSLNHAVLHLEQMLTTGGGWQDQVGGLTGGIKVGHSAAELPLRVQITQPDITAETVQAFSDRLVLVYTGKTRLARNLLQNVVRNWYARDPHIVQTEDNLVSTAWDCSKAFEEGDLAQVGECMNTYWTQKKAMAPGCEPQAVTEMMQALQPHIHGVSLAGAGGGGFMYVLTKQPNTSHFVRSVLSGIKTAESITVHVACVDRTGMCLTIEGEGEVPIPVKA